MLGTICTIWHKKNLTGGLGRCPVSFMFFADVGCNTPELSDRKKNQF